MNADGADALPGRPDRRLLRGTPEPGGLGGLFEDLEQQAAGMHLAERDAELLDRARGEYATVTFASRVHASVGHAVVLMLGDGRLVEGTLAEAGVDWCTVTSRDLTTLWLVRLSEVAWAQGLSTRALPEAARPAVARLGFGSALHRLAEESLRVVVLLSTGVEVRVRVARIGADFAEVEPEHPDGSVAPPALVPFSAVRVVRGTQAG